MWWFLYILSFILLGVALITFLEARDSEWVDELDGVDFVFLIMFLALASPLSLALSPVVFLVAYKLKKQKRRNK